MKSTDKIKRIEEPIESKFFIVIIDLRLKQLPDYNRIIKPKFWNQAQLP